MDEEEDVVRPLSDKSSSLIYSDVMGGQETIGQSLLLC